MILASTLASAASGTTIESARIVRNLAVEQGGAAQASVWFDTARLPLAQAVRVNAMWSDAAASDDSDLRNVAHTGTLVSAVGLGVGEWKNASASDVLSAIAVGYEAAGRFGDMVRGGRPGLHASFIVAFGGTVAAARLLGLTVEQMAHALSLTATTMGGILIGTDSWAREYMAGNAALAAVQSALAAQRGFTANPDLLEVRGGWLDTFGNNTVDLDAMARPLRAPWDIERFLAIKLVPGAHALHSSLEAAIQASKQANVPAGEITRIIHSGPPKTSITYEAQGADRHGGGDPQPAVFPGDRRGRSRVRLEPHHRGENAAARKSRGWWGSSNTNRCRRGRATNGTGAGRSRWSPRPAPASRAPWMRRAARARAASSGRMWMRSIAR